MSFFTKLGTNTSSDPNRGGNDVKYKTVKIGRRSSDLADLRLRSPSPLGSSNNQSTKVRKPGGTRPTSKRLFRSSDNLVNSRDSSPEGHLAWKSSLSPSWRVLVRQDEATSSAEGITSAFDLVRFRLWEYRRCVSEFYSLRSDHLDYDDTALRDDNLQDLIFDLAYPLSRSIERSGE